MNKVIGIFIVVLLATTTYLAIGFNQLSSDNAKLTKKLIDKEEDYNWLERELYSTKKQLDSLSRDSYASDTNQQVDTPLTRSDMSQVTNAKGKKEATKLSKQKTAKQLLDVDKLTVNGQRL